MTTSSNGRIFWGAALAVVVLDVITKLLIQHYLLIPGLPHPVIGDVVRFTLVYNRGAAFSMSLGRYSPWIFGSFAVIALYILWHLYRQTAPGDRSRALALGLAWGGALGNLIDRFRTHGLGVVDFIDIGVGSVRFWTFNVADSAVTIGALLLAWVLWHEDKQPTTARPAMSKTEREAVEERTGT
jgi:signal peptidase II